MKKRLDVRIDASLRAALEIEARQAETTLTALVEAFLREGSARQQEALFEQHNLPVLQRVVQKELTEQLARLRDALQEDMSTEVRNEVVVAVKKLDRHLAALVLGAFREAGVARRMVYAFLQKGLGKEVALQILDDAWKETGKKMRAPEGEQDGQAG